MAVVRPGQEHLESRQPAYSTSDLEPHLTSLLLYPLGTLRLWEGAANTSNGFATQVDG
jgi:hypothetical protein